MKSSIVFFVSLIFFLGSTSSAYESRLITTNNRVHPTMFGGWGPHLRGLMRNSQGDLWMAVDHGSSVDANERIDYYLLSGNRWTLKSSLPVLAGVQQNMAHLISGQRLVLSYGISKALNGIVECYFDTLNVSYKACNLVTVGGRALKINPVTDNYVSAAIAPDGGTRVLTWATVGPNGAGGKYNSIFNDGWVSREKSGLWRGPFIQHLSGYTHLGYVYGQLIDAFNFVGGGQLFVGSYPNGKYQATALRIKLGEPQQLDLLWPSSTDSQTQLNSVEDSLAQGQAQHLIVRTSTGRLGYVFKSSKVQAQLRQYFDGFYRGRFHLNNKYFSLVLGSLTKNEIVIRRVPAALVSTEINWEQIPAETVKVGQPKDFGGITGIYIEGLQTQSQLPKAFNIAVTGGGGQTDFTIGGAQIWQVFADQ